LEVQDRIEVALGANAPAELQAAVQNFGDYIREEVQALRLEFVPELADGAVLEFDDFSVPARVSVVTA
jgi:isoleucyl-tRNA synthetase